VTYFPKVSLRFRERAKYPASVVATRTDVVATNMPYPQDEDDFNVTTRTNSLSLLTDNKSLPLTPSRSATHSFLDPSSINTTQDDDTSNFYIPRMKATETELSNYYINPALLERDPSALPDEAPFEIPGGAYTHTDQEEDHLPPGFKILLVQHYDSATDFINSLVSPPINPSTPAPSQHSTTTFHSNGIPPTNSSFKSAGDVFENLEGFHQLIVGNSVPPTQICEEVAGSPKQMGNDVLHQSTSSSQSNVAAPISQFTSSMFPNCKQRAECITKNLPCYLIRKGTLNLQCLNLMHRRRNNIHPVGTNNPSGRKGTLMCDTCRRRKIKVPQV
jgi:hypothetical protein